MKCIIVTSTGGSVMNELLKNRFFKSNIFSVVSDRQCPAIEKAQQHGVKTELMLESDKYKFYDFLLEYLEHNEIDYVISWFTKLFVGDFLEVYKDRVLNLHSSLLPAFKGFNCFRQAVNYGVRYVGSTIHFIDENLDEGKIIMQMVCPLDVNGDLNQTWHRVFEQQCRSLLQVTKWLADGRITIKGNRVTVQNAHFTDFEFSPSLDFEDAIRLHLPFRPQVFETVEAGTYNQGYVNKEEPGILGGNQLMRELR
ncbi:hypothetical protein KA005_49595 [bacterium]|nr:hypothetical protein [bacterium]